MIFINIGIDIGGSHTAMGLIDSNGSVLNSKEIFYTPQTFDIDECFESINDFVAEHELEAESIGIGIPGFATDTFINYTCNHCINTNRFTRTCRTGNKHVWSFD